MQTRMRSLRFMVTCISRRPPERKRTRRVMSHNHASDPTPFRKFQSLARRILTMPKAELVKGTTNSEQPRAQKRM